MQWLAKSEQPRIKRGLSNNNTSRWEKKRRLQQPRPSNPTKSETVLTANKTPMFLDFYEVFGVFLPASEQTPFWSERSWRTTSAKTVCRWTSHLISTDFDWTVIPRPRPVSFSEHYHSIDFQNIFRKIFQSETDLQWWSLNGFIYQQVIDQYPSAASVIPTGVVFTIICCSQFLRWGIKNPCLYFLW